MSLRITTLFLFSATILTLLYSTQSSCIIAPPFIDHRTISLFPVTSLQARLVTAILTAECQLYQLNNPTATLLVPGQQAILIITPTQFHAITNPSIRPHLPPITLLSANLSATLSVAPHHTNYHTSTTSRSTSATDTNFYRQYRSFSSLQEKWKSLSVLYTNVVRYEVIGQSLQNRDIVLLRIGQTNPENPIRIFLNALQHAREWITTHVATYLVETLAIAAQNTSDPLETLLKKVEVLIVPMVNPDGYVYSNQHRRLARKNRRPTDCPNTLLAGVDLNRNWAVDFGGSESTSLHPCSEFYLGTTAFSEPETRAIRDMVLNTKGIFAHLDIHSYGQLLLGPWLFTDNDSPPLESLSKTLGSKLGRTLSQSQGEEYTFGRSDKLLYLASGTMSDWMTKQGSLSYTLELRPSLDDSIRSGFLLEEEHILPTAFETMDATRVLVSHAGECALAECTQSKRLHTGAIMGICIAALCFVSILLAVGLFLAVKKRKARQMSADNVSIARYVIEMNADNSLPVH